MMMMVELIMHVTWGISIIILCIHLDHHHPCLDWRVHLFCLTLSGLQLQTFLILDRDTFENYSVLWNKLKADLSGLF